MEDAAWSSPKPLEPGQVLESKYRVGEAIGGGAMGLVYDAHHLLLDKSVAVKVLRPELAMIDDVRERFEAEARAAAAIGHPNIANVTDMGRTPSGAIYFVMDRLRGESLGARLEREGRIDPMSAVTMAVEVLAGLEAAHELGLVHRDLKPDNIFIARQANGSEVAKVVDFGVAKALATVGRRSKGTRAGMTVGTPQYMAPEQAAGDADVDARADVYAMGVVLYHMLAGRPPFEGEDVVQVLTAVVSGKAPPLDAACPEAPPALVAIVESAMHRNRARRPRSAAELAQKLQRAVMVAGDRSSAAAAATPTDHGGNDFAALSRPVTVDIGGSPGTPPAARERDRFAPASISGLPLLPSGGMPPMNEGPVLELARDAPPGSGLNHAGDATGVLPAARRGRRRGRVWWLALPVLAAATTWAAIKLRGPEAGPATPVASRSLADVGDDAVIVQLDVSPRGSRILVDGAPPSSNPVRLRKGGTHQLDAVADGHEPGSTVFTSDRAKTVKLVLPRVRSRPAR